MRVLADLCALTKPRIVLMVVITAVAGYEAGRRGPADWLLLLHVVVGTAVSAGGALALNQWMERDVDARMHRTRGRPLPAGRLRPLAALVFGVAATLAGVAHLGALVGIAAAATAAVTSAIYLLVYTPLKRRTPLHTIPGAVAGALPPLIGWFATRDDLGVLAWTLFGVVFLWQLPHTLAIARVYRHDYMRAGIRILPAVDATGTRTTFAIVASAVALTTVSVVPAMFGAAGFGYVAGAIVTGAAVVALGAAEAWSRSACAARRLVLGSVVYLPVVLGLLAFARR